MQSLLKGLPKTLFGSKFLKMAFDFILHRAFGALTPTKLKITSGNSLLKKPLITLRQA